LKATEETTCLGKETLVNDNAVTRRSRAVAAEQDPRWAALLARDAAADGAFYYSVSTTGVYCFPSCAARLARPEHVSFHATREAAEEAGFRPCKRCKPDQGEGARRRAAGEIRFTLAGSSLGQVLVAQSAAGLCAVLLGDDGAALRHDLKGRFPWARLTEGGPGLDTLATRVLRFLESPGDGLDVPLDLRGTEFQKSVWNALLEIPAGSTASYAGIARRIGLPAAARAVARACGANSLAVVIPCHRVVRSDGNLSGYRWGVERKRALLEREAA
jgi:AraC family transcriptional regulator, regulatory protein of adaptative response / methylated-DNA-[protein]-cysteine methyltransferase